MKYRHLLISTLTVALLSACGGTSNSSDNEASTIHPVFNRNKVIQAPTYSPNGDITESAPTFSWQAIAGVTKYHFGHESVDTVSEWKDYIVTPAEAGCPNVGDTCEYTPNDYTMPPNEEKVWWIRGFISGRWLQWSRPIVFTSVDGTGNVSEAPVPLSPTGVINTPHPEFTWESIDGATSYKLGYESPNLDDSWVTYIITNAEANCQTGGECTYTVADPNFTAGQEFAWWLKAEVNNQWSDWSDLGVFSFGQLPQTERPFKFKVKGYIRHNGNHRPVPYNTFEIKTDSAYNYNYNVDCDSDGITEGANLTGNFTCPASTSEETTISISGVFPHFLSGYSIMTEITQWGSQKWRSMENSFQYLNVNGITANVITATDMPDLSNVTSMKGMFSNSELITNPTISMWDVSHVTDMRELFKDTDMNIDISNWDVRNVTNMSEMFENNSTFNQDISNWDVSKVTDMSHMFQSAAAFNQNLNNWDVSNVTDMQDMFYSAREFNQPLSNWNTGKVTNMTGMLTRSKFNQPLNSWDVSHVKSFGHMFESSSFNQDISNWDVSQATDMMYMLHNDNFDQDISTWNVSNVTTMYSMFSYYSAFSTSNYDRLLTTWSTLNLKHNVNLGATNLKYSASAASARQHLVDDFGWNIEDSGQL